MPTTALSIGPSTAIVQNQVYALPGIRCILQVGSGTLQQSSDIAFGTSVTAIVGSELGGAFFRCTSGNVSITLSRA